MLGCRLLNGGNMIQHKQTYINQDFSKQELHSAVFEACKFYNCSFEYADLREAQFVDCRFIESGAIEGCSFNHANLRDASFKGCQLAMSQFVSAECFGIEMRDCDLKGANFVRANFTNRISHKAYFCSAYITRCNLSYTNFERAVLEKCELFENRWNGAHLFGVNFKGADLSSGEFSSEQWESANFEECNLAHVDLEGVDVRRVSLFGAKICDWQQEQLLSQLGIILL